MCQYAFEDVSLSDKDVCASPYYLQTPPTKDPPHTYRYPRPALTVDAVIVAKEAAVPQLLLIQRKIEPFKGCWALPGGFVTEDESLDEAAERELEEETSVSPKDVNLVQVGTFGDENRDPRGWTVTVAYACVVPTTELGVKAADDATNAQWYSINELPELAFDHKKVVQISFERLAKTSSGTIVELLDNAAAKLRA